MTDLLTRDAYFRLDNQPVYEEGQYVVTNALPIPADLFVREFNGGYHFIGSVGPAQTVELPAGLRNGMLLFTNMSPELYTLNPARRHITLHTLYGTGNDSNITIAGVDASDALTVINHLIFPIDIEFEACPTPMACRRYCDSASPWQTRKYSVAGMMDVSMTPPSVFISAMDGALKAETEIRIYRSTDRKLLFKFKFGDPRIAPPWSFGDIRQFRELQVGIPGT